MTELTFSDFDALENHLALMREHDAEVPQWEFCEGFLAALVCCRRAIPANDYFDVLLGRVPVQSEQSAPHDAAFLSLWNRRWAEVDAALQADVQALEDLGAYHPEVSDVQGAMLLLSADERNQLGDEPMPSFAQVWALGFMFAVETWPQEWVSPVDAEVGVLYDAAMQSIIDLTEDDPGPWEVAPFSEQDPPSMSAQRLDHFAQAIWSVYDLYELNHPVAQN